MIFDIKFLIFFPLFFETNITEKFKMNFHIDHDQVVNLTKKEIKIIECTLFVRLALFLGFEQAIPRQIRNEILKK